MPQAFGLIGSEAIDETLGVVDPDITAPPVLRVFDFGKHEPGLHWLQHACRQETLHDGLGAPDMEIEIANASLGLIDDARDKAGTAGGDQVQRDAEALGESLLDSFAQLSAGRNRNDDLAFLLRQV